MVLSSFNLELTGGICLGRSTCLVRTIAPFSRGHSISTFLSSSHRSTVCEIRVMRPHLTSRDTVAPFSILSLRVPLAWIVRVVPLLKKRKSVRAYLAYIKKADVRLRGVGREIDRFDLEEMVFGVLAIFQRVLTLNGEFASGCVDCSLRRVEERGEGGSRDQRRREEKSGGR